MANASHGTSIINQSEQEQLECTFVSRNATAGSQHNIVSEYQF